MVNRCERFADRDCHVDFVTFGGAQVWPCGFGEATLVSSSNTHCQSPPSGVRSAGSASAAGRLLGKDRCEIGIGRGFTAEPGRMLVIAGR
jgi:hypothetical protein